MKTNGSTNGAATPHIRVDIRSLDEHGRDVPAAPTDLLRAVLETISQVVSKLPEAEQLTFARGMQKIFATPEMAKATAAAEAAQLADIGVLHVPIRGEHGEVVAMLDLTGARARGMLKKIGATVVLPDGSEEDLV